MPKGVERSGCILTRGKWRKTPVSGAGLSPHSYASRTNALTLPVLCRNTCLTVKMWVQHPMIMRSHPGGEVPENKSETNKKGCIRRVPPFQNREDPGMGPNPSRYRGKKDAMGFQFKDYVPAWAQMLLFAPADEICGSSLGRLHRTSSTWWA